jgi:hypothetical protein
MSSKILLFLSFLIIYSSLATRILKEENNNEDEQKSCEEEEDEIKSSEIEINYSITSPSKIRKENTPHSQVILPIRRTGTSNMKMGVGPCGGIKKNSANTLTTKGSKINFIWEIIVPENSGNCTVKISNGRQEIKDFKLLTPIDEKVNEDGSFICGRVKGFEYKEFFLPNDYECDGCTLQWKWSTSYGDFYSCSDIIINGGSLSKCMGKCLNGGSCFNGKCLCTGGYIGEFCEEDYESSSKTWILVVFGIIFFAGIGYLLYKYLPNIIQKIKDGWTKRDIIRVQDPFPQNSSQRMHPDISGN